MCAHNGFGLVWNKLIFRNLEIDNQTNYFHMLINLIQFDLLNSLDPMNTPKYLRPKDILRTTCSHLSQQSRGPNL